MDALASLVDRGSHSNSSAAPYSPDLAKHHHGGDDMLVAWIVLQLAGQVTLPILIGTMLFHRKITRRNPTVINLCIVWTLATIPPELLFYAGKADKQTPDPGPILCLFQAATVSAVAPMAAMAYLSVVIHACTIVYDIINANAIQPISLNIRLILLLSSPYVCFLTIALVVAIVGAQDPQHVKRYLFFCEVKKHHSSLTLPLFAFVLMVVAATLIAQIWIAVVVYKHWRAKRRGNVTQRDSSSLDVGLLIRMVFFTIFEIVIIVSCVGTMMNPKMGAAKVLFATPPFAVFLIFASSPDILRAWFPFCFRHKPSKRLADQGSEMPVATTLEDTKDPPPSPMAFMMPPQEYRTQGFDLEQGVGMQRLEFDLGTGRSYGPMASVSPINPTRPPRPPGGLDAIRSSNIQV